MKKKKYALAAEVNDENIHGLIENLSYYKDDLNIEDLIVFQTNLSINNIDLLKSLINTKIINTTKLIKGKFEVFKYLADYEMIIYTNHFPKINDSVLTNSVNHAFSTYFESNQYVERNYKKIINKYEMYRNSYNYDFFIITDKLPNFNKISSWCKLKSIEYAYHLKNRIDGVLDMMLQEFKIAVNILPLNNSNNSLTDTKHKIEDILTNNNPKVSVLMSIYDRIDYLDDAIKSILNQTMTNFEFIIVLEHSKVQDKIYKKLLEYNDKRIIIVKNKKKLGFAKSLNIGLKMASGKYLARMDDDDISSLDRLEKEVKFLELNDEIDIVGSFMKFFDSSNLICRLPVDGEDLKVKCLYKTPLFHPTVMIRLDRLLTNKLFYHDVYAEDYDLWARAIEHLKIANIEDVLYYYRLRNDNNSLKNETLMNNSHHKIMEYQLETYLHLKLSYDELQLLSGRIDVLGTSINLDEVYKQKIKLWNKIRRANKKRNFYKDSSILKEIEEINEYYNKLKEIKK